VAGRAGDGGGGREPGTGGAMCRAPAGAGAAVVCLRKLFVRLAP
jgi:hypothetical protein